LQNYPNVSRIYTGATFDRNLAMRRRNTQLLGLGHPLTDALVAHFQSGRVRGEVTVLSGETDALSVRCIFTTDIGDGHPRKEYRNFLVTADGDWTEAPPRSDMEELHEVESALIRTAALAALEGLQERIKSGIASIEASIRAQSDGVAAVRSRLVGAVHHQFRSANA